MGFGALPRTRGGFAPSARTQGATLVASLPPALCPEYPSGKGGGGRTRVIPALGRDGAGFEEVHLNLAYRWFCWLGLDGRVPDHSTFSKNWHGRFREGDLLRDVFDGVVQRCMAQGLVGANGFAVDAKLDRGRCQQAAISSKP